MIKTKKIKINKKNYILKAQSYRAMFLFEDITGKSAAEVKTVQDQITYIYCILNASNKDFEYNLEEFIDILDEDNSVVEEFAKLVTSKKK